LKLIH
jgi:hypothetical protein